jgi:peptidoglycan-binding protein ArfA
VGSKVGSKAGIRAGFGETAATTSSRRPPPFFRKSPGVPWLIGALVIPLLIAAIGYVTSDLPQSVSGPSAAPPAPAPSSTSAAPKIALAALSIARSGNNITVGGNFPDASAKAALMKTLKDSLPANVNVVDQTHIDPSVNALDFSNAVPVFKDSASIADFNLTVSGDTVTLSGTATSQDQKNVVAQEATGTWSKLHVVDKLVVNGPIPPAGSPGPVPPPPPPAPSPCTNLQAGINTATGGPIVFGNDGFSLTPEDDPILTQVADKLKACPTAHVTLNGYTDNSGTEAINIPLSTQRAGTVADFLVTHGVARDQLSVKGLGSMNPVAGNDTSEGRAKNRRVEIVVS